MAPEMRDGGGAAFPDEPSFDEYLIDTARACSGGGWEIGHDGWMFFVPPESPVEPVAGMTCRMYPGGIGRAVRGLFLDGQKVFYRIQITTAEILRHLLAEQYDATKWDDAEAWKRDRDAIDAAVSPIVKGIGLSGAQWGAAMSLATSIYTKGPRGLMEDPALKDRHIQVSREMPSLVVPADAMLTARSQPVGEGLEP